MLKINLLGKIKIEYLGENLESKLSNKTVAMIYLLIANKGRYLSKDKLVLYLWPDSTEEAAKYNLRYNLWILKKILPQDETGENLILADKDGCILNENYPLECDLLAIRELDYANSGIGELLYVKELLSGNIMEGWYLKNCSEFNELIIFDRMMCENRHMEILRTLASRYEENKEYSKALDTLKEYAVMEPENEGIALRIMKLHVLLGNRTGAISYYKSFEATLWNNLKISPEDSIKNYYENLLRGSCGEADTLSNSVSRQNIALREKISIRAFCIENVEYFLLSDILAKTLKKIKLSVLMQLGKSMIEELGNIDKEIVFAYEKAGGEPCSSATTILQVRIIRAFSSYVELLAEHYDIEITIEHYQKIDAISKKVLEYLENLQLESLHIYIA